MFNTPSFSFSLLNLMFEKWPINQLNMWLISIWSWFNVLTRELLNREMGRRISVSTQDKTPDREWWQSSILLWFLYNRMVFIMKLHREKKTQVVLKDSRSTSVRFSGHGLATFHSKNGGTWIVIVHWLYKIMASQCPGEIYIYITFLRKWEHL